jgi:hypothetical protein
LNGFRIAFGSLIVFAIVTSALAGWGLLGSEASFLGPASPATTTTAAVSTTSSLTTTLTTTTSISSSTSVASSGNATTTVVGGGVTSTTTVTAGGTTVTTTVAQGGGIPYGPAAAGSSLLREVQAASLFLAPVSWVLVGGAWIWRGRVRSRYTEMGFGSDVFELFMKMKGGATRIRVLNKLNTPKDRLQLAEELGVDWKTVDRHVQILNRYGFVREQAAYGTVRLYEVTPMGRMLLNLFEDLERNNGPVSNQQGKTPVSDEKGPQF